jgi:YesN/AraC family two-component response regulator
MYEGSGIGLALAKELIELHNGTISAHRNEELTGENGTTFRIELPIGEISNTNLVQPEPSNQPEIQTKIPVDFKLKDAIELPDFDNSKKIVVLVDDNLIIRTFIKAILQTNYKIVEAADGLEGIELARTIIPDIIITDVMMPKLDGISMVQQLRNNDKTSHIPIIMLSGKAALEDKITGLETGIEAYLTKPFSVKELQLIIHNLIQKRELLRSKYQNKFVVSTDEIPLESVDQQFLEKVMLHIKTNIENTNYSVEQLGEHMHMSSSQLHRKLHALLNQAPGQLIRNIRLQRAADLIKQNAGTLADICYLTGFNDQAYFSRAFKNQFGCSPSTYKKNRITPIL